MIVRVNRGVLYLVIMVLSDLRMVYGYFGVFIFNNFYIDGVGWGFGRIREVLLFLLS